MERFDIEKQFHKLVLERSLNLLTLKDNTILSDDLGLDSLDQLELLMETERKFNISISDELVDSVKTFGNCVDLIYFLVNKTEIPVFVLPKLNTKLVKNKMVKIKFLTMVEEIHTNVLNTSYKKGLYTIVFNDGVIHKYPLDNILRIIEC